MMVRAHGDVRPAPHRSPQRAGGKKGAIQQHIHPSIQSISPVRSSSPAQPILLVDDARAVCGQRTAEGRQERPRSRARSETRACSGTKAHRPPAPGLRHAREKEKAWISPPQQAAAVAAARKRCLSASCLSLCGGSRGSRPTMLSRQDADTTTVCLSLREPCLCVVRDRGSQPMMLTNGASYANV